MQDDVHCLRSIYTTLINHTLPGAFTHPIRFNHCFGRIILDWTFNDAWHRHLHKKLPAYQQLTHLQLSNAIQRMHSWLKNPQLLMQDNNASLSYRGKKQQVPFAQ